MRNLPIFLLLVTLKGLIRLFYSPKASWPGGLKPDFRDVRIFVLLNHTSLFEPLLLGAFPLRLLWEMSKRMLYPVAEKTYRRPVAGRFFRLLAPGTVSLTRNRDESWERFLRLCNAPGTLVAIAPEGRMKRPDGLDRNGKPMNLKSGIVDIIRNVNSGKMLLLYSGGLHHIQTPGSGFPKLFKKFSMRFEALDIPEYKRAYLDNNAPLDQQNRIVTGDLQRRRDLNCAPEKASLCRPLHPEFEELLAKGSAGIQGLTRSPEKANLPG